MKKEDHPFVPTCPICGKYNIPTSADYVSCPEGHGKLVPRCNNFDGRVKALMRKKWLASMPVALLVGHTITRRHVFSIDSKGWFVLARRQGSWRDMKTENVATLDGKPKQFVEWDGMVMLKEKADSVVK